MKILLFLTAIIVFITYVIRIWILFNENQDKGKVGLIKFIFSGIFVKQQVNVSFKSSKSEIKDKALIFNILTLLLYLTFIAFNILYFFYYNPSPS